MKKRSVSGPGVRVGIDFGGGAPGEKLVNVHIGFYEGGVCRVFSNFVVRELRELRVG